MALTATETAPPPWSLTAAGSASAATPAKQTPPADGDFGEDEGYMFGADGLTFGDVVDIVNPLQHLPVVSTLYRAITGDEIDPGARMIGGALFGGPAGFAGAVVNNAMVEHTGKDVGETVLAALTPDDAEPATEPVLAVASATPDTPDGKEPAFPAPVQMAASSGPVQPGPEGPLFDVTGLSPLIAPAGAVAPLDSGPRPQPFAAVPQASPIAPAPATARNVAAQPQIAAAAPARTARPTMPAEAAQVLEKTRARSEPAFAPTPLDPALIPEAMLSALEKYEQMKRGS